MSMDGPDAETLAAMTQTVQFSVSQDDDPVTRRAAREALSGLVALVEQRERERDDLRSLLHHEYRQATELLCEEGDAHVATRKRAEKAELLLARHRQALEMLWAHYLLPITDEQKDEVRAALAASAPGTEEPA